MIELLYFDGCPSWKDALSQLREQIGEEEPIVLISVETQEEAERQKFVGSPTIRVGGEDLFPMPFSQYALGCRVYFTPEGLRGIPTPAMLREALVRHEVLNG